MKMYEKIKRLFLRGDLIPGSFPKTEWNGDNLEEPVEEIYHYVVNEAEKSWKFYYNRRKSKRIFGFLFRLGMIIAGSMAAAIPILGAMYSSAEGEPWINPGWASVALAIAAFLGAVDKLGDFSGSRARYLVTGRKIIRDLDKFRFKWAQSRIKLKSKDIDAATALKLVGKCMIFHEHIDNTIKQEIDEWMRLFKKSLSDKSEPEVLEKQEIEVHEVSSSDLSEPEK